MLRALATFSVLALVCAGCANKDLPGVEEFKQITTKARKTIESSLRSVDEISASSSRNAPRRTADFSSEVQRLEVDSIKMRSRVQAILARGDAYFADWSEHIGRIKNPHIRERAERFRPQLEQSFTRIKSATQQAGASFKPYLAGLRELRQKLETKPDELETGAGTALLSKTREHGQQVVRELDNINSELRAVITMLTTDKSDANK